MVINNCELNPFCCSLFAKDGAKINKISGKIQLIVLIMLNSTKIISVCRQKDVE